MSGAPVLPFTSESPVLSGMLDLKLEARFYTWSQSFMSTASVLWLEPLFYGRSLLSRPRASILGLEH